MTKLLTLVVLTRLPLKGCQPDPMHLKGAPSLWKHAKHLFNPQSPKFQKRWILGILKHFSGQILSLFLFKSSLKYIKKLLISVFSQQSRGNVLALFFSSLVLGPWI